MGKLTGIFSLVLTFVVIPICYNAARERLEEKSKFELRYRHIGIVNWGVVGFFLVTFAALLYTTIFQHAPTS